jgi:transcriptional regulator with XRE-family HTH domain
MEYGKALRIIIDEQGIKQADLARRMGTSTSYVSQLCSGKIKEPTLSKAFEIADALGVSVDHFVEVMRSDM